MNKKYLMYSLFIAVLTFNSLSFSMYNAPKVIYYGSKILATSALPVGMTGLVYKALKDTEKECAGLPDVKSHSPIAQEWGEGIIKELGYYKYDISLKCGTKWASFSHKNKKYIIFPSFREVFKLEVALEQQKNAQRWQKMTWYEKIKTSFFEMPDQDFLTMSNCDQYIDEQNMSFKHEMGHIVANDCENSVRMKLAIPIAVETVYLGTNYAFNKLRKISPPTTIIKSLGRSGLAFAGIVPKILCNRYIFGTYYRTHSRYREAEADRFACDAATRQELEAFYGFHKYHEQMLLKKICEEKQITPQEVTEKMLRSEHDKFDFHHSCSADRAAETQKFIDKWDAKHPKDNC